MFDEDELFLRSDDSNSKHKGAIKFILESCQEEPDCKSREEIKEYW